MKPLNNRYLPKINTENAILITGPGVNYKKFSFFPNIQKIYSFDSNEDKYKNLNLHDIENIIIYAHGSLSKEGLRSIVVEQKQEYEYTYNFLSKIQSLSAQHKPLNIEILSCNSGASIEDINYLNEGSTLITSTARANYCNSSKNYELIFKTWFFIGNPFIKFIANLFNNHDDNNFAINLGRGKYNIFRSSNDEITEYSIEILAEWKKNELKKFKDFLSCLPETNCKSTNKHLKETINFFNDEKMVSNFIEVVFNPIRYRELILLNSCPKENSLVTIQKLIESGVDINAVNFSNYPLLSLASHHEAYEIVKTLLKYGANPNIQDENGTNALVFACAKGNLQIIKLLLDNQANPNIQTKWGNTCLIIAAKKNHIDVVKLLLDYNADPNITNFFEMSVLDVTPLESKKEIFYLLMNYIKTIDYGAKTKDIPIIENTYLVDYLDSNELNMITNNDNFFL